MPTFPTLNTRIAHRRADFRSVPEMLNYAAQGETGVTFYNAKGEILSALSWHDVRARAHVVARKLIGAGFEKGERILLTADTWPGFFDIFFGCQYAGLLPVPVSIPLGIGGKDAYLDQLRRQIAASGAVAAIGIDELAGFIAEAAQEFPAIRLHGGMDVINNLPDVAVDLRPLGPDDDCYIQFSSGSTRHPHGVRIVQRALMANLDAMTGPGGLNLTAADRTVTWLPLYHDMGLVGFLLGPLSCQCSIDFLTPRDFARRPLQWLNLISRNRATVAYSPSFGYDLATRRGGNQVPADLDLSCWRHAGIGGDMVRADVLDRFAQTFAPSGFNPKIFIPSYGMAEVCLAITFGPDKGGVRTDTIDRVVLASEQRAQPATDPTDLLRARRFVLCGKVVPGHRLEVRGPDSKVVADRIVGRIFVQGPSIMPGYFNDPEATREILSADGWLDTGDLGYTLAGDVVVTGRAKDLIIINGRNIWPQDIEWTIEAKHIVKTEDCVAFSVDDGEGERVVVAVLARVASDHRDDLVRDVAGAVREAIAVDCEVVLVPPTMGLPKTSSGKLSRARTRANYLAGLYKPAAVSSKPAAA